MPESLHTRAWNEDADEARFRALSEAAFEGILIIEDGRIVQANRRAAQLFGYTDPVELVGKAPADLTSPDARRRVAGIISENRPTLVEATLLRADGSTLQAEVHGRPFTFRGRMARVAAIRDISERVQAEEALRASEERYRKLTETAVDAIITTDALGVIQDWNHGAEAMFGYSREEAVGLPVITIMPERYVAAHVAGMERVNTTGETRIIGHTAEVHGLHKDGGEFPLELSLSRWTTGGMIRYTGIIRDITERKTAEEQLRLQSLYVRLLQDVAVAANEADSIESAMQFAVDAVCRFTGWPVGHVYLGSGEGRNELVPSGIWHAEERPGIAAFRQATSATPLAPGVGLPGRVLATGRPAWVPDVTQDPNFPRARMAGHIGVRAGFAFPVLVRREVAAVLEFFADHEAEPDEPLLQAMAHIGAQLGRVVERKRAQEAARSSQELLASVLTSSLDAISAVRAVRGENGAIIDFEWLLANPRAVQLAGVDRADLVGCLVRRNAPASPDAVLFSAYRKVVETGEPYEETFEYQAGDAAQWLHVTAVKLGDGCSVTLRNETERIQARQAVERANEALVHRNRELQEFAYVASHDLQEPLRKISSFADLLRTDYGGRLDENGVHYLERMQSAAVRMSRLITDLLTFSRVSTRGQAFERVDLNAVVHDVLSDLELLIKDAGGRVLVEHLPAIDADRTQMHQLFQNLISNSLKFHLPDRPLLVQVRAVVEHDPPGAGPARPAVCRIEVEDNGIGFDEKYADRIFMPFQRLHSEARYPGTGIGLALCRRIVDRHSGTITAHSTPGTGTTFVVILPVEQNVAV